jgi:ribosomal-protein-alanine N-acetyltransferase
VKAAPLPPIGLLLSKAFDRGVVVTLNQWPWFVVCVVATVALRHAPWPWDLPISYAIGVVWFTAALAGAAKLARPGFAPTSRFVLRAAVVYLIYETVFPIGFLLLVIPGFYFATRLWLAAAAVALEDKGVRAAIARSWELTGRAFGPTLVLLVLLICVDLVVVVLGLLAVRASVLLHFAAYRATLDVTEAALRAGALFYIDAAAISAKLLWLPVLAAQPATVEPRVGPRVAAGPSPITFNKRDEAPIETPRLWLEPIVPEHAKTLYAPLQDPLLYRYVSQPPPESESALRRRFEQLATGRSPDYSQIWLNWAARAKIGPYVGLVQATIEGSHALIGYDIFVPFWRHGYGKEACRAMIDAARREYGVTSVSAIVDVDNTASIALLESLGFTRTWTGPSDDMPGHTDHRYERVLG